MNSRRIAWLVGKCGMTIIRTHASRLAMTRIKPAFAVFVCLTVVFFAGSASANCPLPKNYKESILEKLRERSGKGAQFILSFYTPQRATFIDKKAAEQHPVVCAICVESNVIIPGGGPALGIDTSVFPFDEKGNILPSVGPEEIRWLGPPPTREKKDDGKR